MDKAFSELIKHMLNGGDILPEVFMELAERHHVKASQLVDCVSNRLSFDTSFLSLHLINGRNAMRMPSLSFYASEAKKSCEQFHKSRDVIHAGYALLRYACALVQFDPTFRSLVNNVRVALWSFNDVPAEKIVAKEREFAIRALENAHAHIVLNHAHSTSGKLILQCLSVFDCMLRGMMPLPVVPTIKHNENGSIVRLLCDFGDSRTLTLLSEEKLCLSTLPLIEKHRLLKFMTQCATDCSFPLYLLLDYTRQKIVFSESALIAACKSLL